MVKRWRTVTRSVGGGSRWTVQTVNAVAPPCVARPAPQTAGRRAARWRWEVVGRRGGVGTAANTPRAAGEAWGGGSGRWRGGDGGGGGGVGERGGGGGA